MGDVAEAGNVLDPGDDSVGQLAEFLEILSKKFDLDREGRAAHKRRLHVDRLDFHSFEGRDLPPDVFQNLDVGYFPFGLGDEADEELAFMSPGRIPGEPLIGSVILGGLSDLGADDFHFGLPLDDAFDHRHHPVGFLERRPDGKGQLKDQHFPIHRGHEFRA